MAQGTAAPPAPAPAAPAPAEQRQQAAHQAEHAAQQKKEHDEAIKRIVETETDREALAERALSAETEADRQERANRDMKTIRDMAESATGHLPRAGDPVTPGIDVAAVRQGDEPMVKMQFTRSVTLTLPGYRTVRFAAGIQEVPQSLADDPYLTASGVTRV